MSRRPRRSRKRQQISLLTNIIFSLITLSALTGCIILLLQNYGLKDKSQEVINQLEEYESMRGEYIYTQSDLEAYFEEASAQVKEEGKKALLDEMKQMLLDGESSSQVFRTVFKDNVIVYADGGYKFFPISETLKKNDYVYKNFVSQENGEIVYVDDGQVVHSLKGIDVSRHQGKIDWKKVAADGVSYAFIRVGFRGSTEGKLVEDEYFKDNIEGALDNNINVGIYFYTQAITEEEAVEEADFVIDLIKKYDVTYPVVLDIEETGSSTARTAQMSQEDYTKATIAFCERIKEAGYTPMIYGNLKTFMIMLDLEKLEVYEKWFAYYETPVYFPYEFSVWQYSSKGKVDGIEGDVDLNVCMKDYSD